MPAVLDREAPERVQYRDLPSAKLAVRRRELLTARVEYVRPNPPIFTKDRSHAAWYVLWLATLVGGLGLVALTVEFLARLGQ